jgi:hypothetical protein
MKPQTVERTEVKQGTQKMGAAKTMPHKVRNLISPHPNAKKLHTYTNVIFSTSPLIPPVHTLAE